MTTSTEKSWILRHGADTSSHLSDGIRSLSRLIEDDDVSLDDLERESSDDVASAPHRLAVVTSSLVELRDQLARAVQCLETGKGKRLLGGRGVFLSDLDLERGKLAMLFPGQGAQSVGMLGELSSCYEVVRGVFDEADAVLADTLGRPLSDFITGRHAATLEAALEALT